MKAHVQCECEGPHVRSHKLCCLYPGKAQVLIVQEAEWTLRSFWTRRNEEKYPLPVIELEPYGPWPRALSFKPPGLLNNVNNFPWTLNEVCVECSVVWYRDLDTTMEWTKTIGSIWDVDMENDGACKMDRRNKKCSCARKIERRKNNAGTENQDRNWVGHRLRTNCLLKDALEGMVNGKRVPGRRRYQVLDNIMIKGLYE